MSQRRREAASRSVRRHKGRGGRRSPAKRELPSIRSIVTGQLLSFLISLLVILLVVAFGKTPEAEHLFNGTYDYLQWRLLAASAREHHSKTKVVIVDISALPPKNGETPRKELQRIIETVMKWNPEAVGVDIDFAPLGTPRKYWASLDDPRFFFDYCLRYKGTLYLGVARSLGGPRADWLGMEQYADLAASLYVEKGARKMLSEVMIPPHRSTCPGMAFSLAKCPNKPLYPQHRLFGLAQFNDRLLSHDVPIADTFLIDYSRLEEMQSHWCIPYSHLKTSRPSFAEEKPIVLIGDAKHAVTPEDSFVIPDRRDEPVPGVFTHACAAYTLIGGKPLYWIDEAHTEQIDMMAALLAAASVGLAKVILLRCRWLSASPSEKLFETLATATEWAVIGTFLLIGVIYVHHTRIFWHTFPCPLLAQTLRSPVENAAQTAAHWAWRRR